MSMNSISTTRSGGVDTKPAYHYKWFWIIVSPLILVLIACTITITIAVKNSDDVVIGNYYKEGLLLNEKNDQERLAKAMALNGKMQFVFEQNEVVVNFDNKNVPALFEWPQTIILALSHPAFADQDVIIPLNVQGGSEQKRYSGNLSKTLEGRWYWQLLPTNTADDVMWQIKGEVDFAESATVVLL